MPVGITECSRIDVLGFVRVRVAGRYLELQEICNLQQPVSSSIWLELRDLGELEKVRDIADEEFAERRGDQVACRPVREVEACRHSPDIGPSIMLLQTPQSVGESHRHVDGLSVEVFCDAVGARHVRRHELTLHAHADGVNRPPPGDRSRQIGNDGLDELLCYRCIDHAPLHYGWTAEVPLVRPVR